MHVGSFSCSQYIFEVMLWLLENREIRVLRHNFYGKFMEREPSRGILLVSQMSMVFQFWFQCIFLPRVRNYINTSKPTISLWCVYPWPYLGKEHLCDFTLEESFFGILVILQDSWEINRPSFFSLLLHTIFLAGKWREPSPNIEGKCHY